MKTSMKTFRGIAKDMKNLNKQSFFQKIENLFKEHAGTMLLYAQSLLKAEMASAEDVVQEVFLELLSISKLPDKPKNYLLRATRNRAFNQKRGLKLRTLENLDETKASLLNRTLYFSHPIEREEERERLSLAMQAMPDEQREVVILKIWGEMTFSEIAQMTGIPANTAASRYRYALEHLEFAMNKYFVGEEK